MAFDGIVTTAVTKELSDRLTGGKIDKIYQPSPEEIFINVHCGSQKYRLYLSANTNHAGIYLTEEKSVNPQNPPGFCMLLRKHLQSAASGKSGRWIPKESVEIYTDAVNELGFSVKHKLIAEIMGKHSNIIFCKEDGTIIDSIKHVSANMSSVREVLPGREYFIPQTVAKENPLTVTEADFCRIIKAAPMTVQKALYNHFTGISPIVAEEVCHLASIDSDLSANGLSEAELTHLAHTFCLLMEDVKEGRFSPAIIYDEEGPLEYASFP